MKYFLLIAILITVNIVQAQDDETDTTEAENKIDVFFPDEGAEVTGGTKLNIGWVANYESDIDKLKLYLSTNNGLKWHELPLANENIKSAGLGYSYTFTAPDSLNSELCRIRIKDTKENVQGESSVFGLKIPSSDQYGISFGFNFDFFDGVRVSDFYTSAEIHIPRLLLKYYGVDFILGRGTGHAEDSLVSSEPFYLDPNTLVLSTVNNKRLDVTNIFMSASGVLGPLKYIYFVLPHFEYRRAIKTSFLEYERIMVVSGVDSTVTFSSQEKKSVDEFLVGLGFGLRIDGRKYFKLNLSATWDYSFGAKFTDPTRGSFFRSTDIVLRFKLTEPQTNVSFGGELKYPAIHSNNTPAELMFFFVKGFSLTKLYDSFFGE